MDFGSGTPKRAKRPLNIRDSRNLTKKNLENYAEAALDGRYPSAVQLYPTPPTQDISLESFEDLAVQRLRVSYSRFYKFSLREFCVCVTVHVVRVFII